MTITIPTRVRVTGIMAVIMIALTISHAAYAQDCPADANGDAAVDILDLLQVLADWGPCDAPCPPSCASDIDDDCTVGILDLLAVLNAWGPCPCDPNGTWVIDGAPVQYVCAFGLVDINIDTFVFSQTATTLSVTGEPSFSVFLGGPIVMTGPAVNCGFGETFSVSATIAGECSETYTLQGTFITDDQFVATFTMEFAGGENCLDCLNQEFTVLCNRAP